MTNDNIMFICNIIMTVFAVCSYHKPIISHLYSIIVKIQININIYHGH